MALITLKGRALGLAFSRKGYAITDRMLEVLSCISRSAQTYNRIQEAWCGEEMSERTTKALERREQLLEKNMQKLAASLEFGPSITCTVSFEGDPRGHTERLKTNTFVGDDYIGVDQ